MKKTALVKDIVREVKRSFGRFMSILLIVALGVGFFVGVKATAPSIYKTAEQVFNDSHMMDLEVLSTVGFSEEDAEAVRAVEGVDRVEVAYSLDAIYYDLGYEEESSAVKLLSISSDQESAVNIPSLIEGRMPESADECVVCNAGSYEDCYSPGDVIVLEDEAGDTMVDDVLTSRVFTVVGIADFPQYFSYQLDSTSIGGGTIDLAVMVPEEAFCYSRYTVMYITLDCHEQGITGFSDEYETIIDNISTQLSAIGDIRYKLFTEEKQKELDAAEEEYSQGEQEADEQLSDSKKQLEDAKKQIEEGREELMAGWAEYEAGKKDAAEQIADAEEEIEEYEELLEEAAVEIKEGWEEYRTGKAEAEQELSEARAELDAYWVDYQDGQQQLLDAEQEIADAETELASAKSSLEEAQQTLNEANTVVSSMNTMIGTMGDFTYTVDDDEMAQFETYLAQAEAEQANYQAQLDGLDPNSTEYIEVAAELQVATSIVNVLGNRVNALHQNRQVTSYELQSDVNQIQAEIDSAQATLDSAQAQITAAEAELDEAKTTYATEKANFEAADYESQLNEGEAEYAAAVEEMNTELAEAQQELLEAEQEFKEGKAELEEAKVLLAEEKANAEEELSDAKKELNEAEGELADAEDEYSEGLTEYNEAVAEVEEELADARSQILSGQSMMAEIISGKWYVFDRDDMVVQHANLKSDAQRINAIADIFPVFFLMVAALVCLTTMSRLIDEQRIQMGTYKALGYTQWEIASKYLLYAACACIGGCAVGPVLGVTILPRVIFGAYNVLYSFPVFSVAMPVSMLIVSIAVALCCTVLVAGICCFRELRVTTAQLMRPKAPKVGKKIFLEKIPFIWNRFSFFQKLTARNLLRYKVRFLMTVIGIAGCMALVVAGFGLQDAIDPILSLQFDEINDIDALMYSDSYLTEEEAEELNPELAADDRIAYFMAANMTSVKMHTDSKMMDECYVYVPQYPDQLEGYLKLRTMDGEAVQLTDEGAVITEKIGRKLGLSVGDTFEVQMDEERYEVRIAGVVENYVYNYVYMTGDYYQEVFGKEHGYNVYFVTGSEKMTDRDDFVDSWLIECDAFISINFVEDLTDVLNDTISSLKIVVLVLIICAGALAFVVLFNLTNINIAERMREIATVKVLGFNHRETNSYIFRENLIMSIIGVLVGSALGWLLARYLVSAVEVNTITFWRKVRFVSYIYSAGLTMLFTVLVNFFMKKKIRDISMVESLKAVE